MARSADNATVHIVDGGNGNGNIQVTAVFRDPNGFVVRNVFPLPDSCEDSGNFVGPILQCEDRDVLADDFLGTVSVHSLRTSIPAGYGAIERFADDGVFGGIDDGGQAGAILADLLGGLALQFLVGSA